MSWLATLDAKARTWPAIVRGAYHGVKWFLIAMGVYLSIGLAYIEVVKEHGIGLGAGIVVSGILAVTKGVLMAFRQTSTPPETPHPH